MKRLQKIFLLLLVFSTSFIYSQTFQLEQNWWQPNGTVKSIVKDESKNMLFVAGSFTAVGPYEPQGSQIDISTSQVDVSIYNPNNMVNTIVPDGNGGWFLGGIFTKLGNLERNGIAHIDVTGNVTTWNPNIITYPERVNSIFVSNNIVYVGGMFSTIGGTYARQNLAAIDINTGLPTTFNPSPNSEIFALYSLDNQIYVGGDYSIIGGVSKLRLASLDVLTGLPTTWSPNPNGKIYSLTKNDNNLFVGGLFTSLNSAPRNMFGVFDISTGDLSTWSPSFNNKVNKIVVKNNDVFLCGDFTTVNGQPRRNIASISLFGNVTSWNPDYPFVKDFDINDNYLFMVGTFSNGLTDINNARIAQFDLATMQVTTWNCSADGNVNKISITNQKLYIGGQFRTVGCLSRSGIAAYNINTGTVSTWTIDPVQNIGLPISINALLVNNDTLFVAGEGNATRSNFCAINIPTAYITTWDVKINGTINCLLKKNNSLFVGGSFDRTGETPNFIYRNNLLELKNNSTIPTSWNPNSSSTVSDFVEYNNNLFIAGNFQTIGGFVRPKIASIDINTSQATSWQPNPAPTSAAYSIAIKNNLVFAGGVFSLKAYDLSTASYSSWSGNNRANNHVYDLNIFNNDLFVSGLSSPIRDVGSNQNRFGLGSINIDSGSLTAFNPDVSISSPIYGLEVYSTEFFDNKIAFGGKFDWIGKYSEGGIGHMNFAVGTITTQTNNCNTASQPTITAPTTYTCNSLAVTLSISSGSLNDAASWKWYSNSCGGSSIGTGSSISVSPSTSTVYYARGEGGCAITPGLCGSYSLFASSPASATSVMLSNGSLISLGFGFNHQWIDCNNGNSFIPGATSQVFTPAQSGNYAVVLSNGNCSATSTCTSYISTSVQENFTKEIILLFPNPTTGILNINTSEEGTIVIYSIDGSLVLTKQIPIGFTNIDLSYLPKGIYNVKYTTTKSSTNNKLILN